MSILMAIDAFLSTTLVRWTLLAATVALLALSVWLKVKLVATNVQLDSARAEINKIKAEIGMQNEAIRIAGDRYKALEHHVSIANGHITALEKKISERAPVVVTAGPCEDMVQQAAEEIRKGLQ